MEVQTISPRLATLDEVDIWVKSQQVEAAKAGEFAKKELLRMQRNRSEQRLTHLSKKPDYNIPG